MKQQLIFLMTLSQTEDVDAIISGKLALKYAGRDIEAMRAVARAHTNRSLEEFEAAKQQYKPGSSHIYFFFHWFSSFVFSKSWDWTPSFKVI
jgi:hypothetical protein